MDNLKRYEFFIRGDIGEGGAELEISEDDQAPWVRHADVEELEAKAKAWERLARAAINPDLDPRSDAFLWTQERAVKEYQEAKADLEKDL